MVIISTTYSKLDQLKYKDSIITIGSFDGVHLGHKKVFEKAVEFYGDKGDLLILISSSGRSANVVNAAKRAKELNMGVITFSGFKSDNALRKL